MFDYTIKKYKRSRSIKILVHADGQVVVTAPSWVTKKVIENFVLDRQAWIVEQLAKTKNKIKKDKPALPSFHSCQARAKKLITERLKYYNQFYNFKYNRVVVRRQKTRWGSCSTKKHLNFNYKLFFLPLELVDYVVVHELCHLEQMNHSKKFWNLVAKTIPDHKERRKHIRGLDI
ncbi:MAG: M48 family metallopeptidase [Candidatus Magasanikiibacteriota bacterium]